MNEKKEKILLFAKELVISEQRFNQATGKVEIVKHNTIDALKEHRINFLPMPQDWILKPAKGDTKEFKLSDLGIYVLAKIDEQGRIINDYLGKNFRKPTPVDLDTLLGLRALFVSEEAQTEKKAEFAHVQKK